MNNNFSERVRKCFGSYKTDWRELYPGVLNARWERVLFDKMRNWVAKYLNVPTSKLGYGYGDRSKYESEESELLQNYGPGRKIIKFKDGTVGTNFLNQNLIVFFVDK